MPEPMEPKEIEATVNEFQQKLERLRVHFEQYFMGIEKREPDVLLKDVVRIMYLLEQEQIKNTAVRFRYRTLVQKFNVYRTYWNRNRRAKEAGTYHRDVARLRRRYAEQGIDLPQVGRMTSPAAVERAVTQALSGDSTRETPMVLPSAADTATPVAQTPTTPRQADPVRARLAETPTAADEAPIQLGELEPAAAPPAAPKTAALAQTVAAPPRLAPSARPPAAAPPRPAAADNLPEQELQSIYRRFIKAKKMCGEDTSSVHYEALAKTIARQLPALREMHQGKPIEFQVVIRQGRAILKAKPKEP